MKNKHKNSTDEKSESSKESSEQSTKNLNVEEIDSVSPQKRKGTIWKILFPDKKNETEGTELERLVCKQVEYQISKNPNVINCCNELENFENSEEANVMDKHEFTLIKNRISAQLSRERRQAILHSLINVCLENIKAKRELDDDIDEAKNIIKSTICECCKTKFKEMTNLHKNSTINKEAASDAHTKPKQKKNSMISISRNGTFALIMSLAVFACIATMSLLPQTENKPLMINTNLNLLNYGEEIQSLNNMEKRYLRSTSENFDDVAETPKVVDIEKLSQKRVIRFNSNCVRMPPKILFLRWKKLNQNYVERLHNDPSFDTKDTKIIPIYTQLNSQCGKEPSKAESKLSSDFSNSIRQYNPAENRNVESLLKNVDSLNKNLPAPLSLIPEAKSTINTMYCDSSKLLINNMDFINMDKCNNIQILVPFNNFIALMNENEGKFNSNIFSSLNEDPSMNGKNAFLEMVCNIKSINKIMLPEGHILP